jgi:hypothetical protein
VDGPIPGEIWPMISQSFAIETFNVPRNDDGLRVFARLRSSRQPEQGMDG